MNFIVTNFSTIVDIVKGIFSGIFLIASFILSQRSYNTFIKYKNKNIQLNSPRSNILKGFLFLVIWFPIQIIILQLSLIGFEIWNISSYIMAVLIIFVFIMTCFLYLKNLIEEDKTKNINFKDYNFFKKIGIIFGYIFTPLIFLLCMGISILLSIVSNEIIRELKGIVSSEVGKYVVGYIIFYIMNVYLGSMIYYTEKSNLKRYVKEVRIFYIQNNKQKVELDIKYEDFNINKEFIVYYSSRKKSNVVIPTKDLVRIEYYYYD